MAGNDQYDTLTFRTAGVSRGSPERLGERAHRLGVFAQRLGEQTSPKRKIRPAVVSLRLGMVRSSSAAAFSYEETTLHEKTHSCAQLGVIHVCE